MTNALNMLEQMLEKEARQFEGQNGEKSEPRTSSIIVLDLEFLWDRSAHAGYKICEGTTACDEIRRISMTLVGPRLGWTCRRTCAQARP